MITFLTKNKSVPIKAHNSLCKIAGVANTDLLRKILYSGVGENEYFETRLVPQEDLYDGKEYYIRLLGISSEGGILNSVLEKVANSNVTLSQIAYIKQGIVSGADKYTDAHQRKFNLNFPKGKGIFVITASELKDLQLPEQERKKYVKPVYKNSEISKYHINYRNQLYVFYMTREMNENDAPTIIRYLRQFKPILENRLITYNESYPWFSLHRQRDQTILENDEKIVNSRRAKSNIFALETKHYYEQSDLMITVIKPEFLDMYSTKYVLGVLNSKLYYVWLRNRGKVKGNMLEMYGAPLEEIPIKKPDIEDMRLIEQEVESIITSKNNEDKHLAIIDSIVYKIYGLNNEEIKFVEDYHG